MARSKQLIASGVGTDFQQRRCLTFNFHPIAGASRAKKSQIERNSSFRSSRFEPMFSRNLEAVTYFIRHFFRETIVLCIHYENYLFLIPFNV